MPGNLPSSRTEVSNFVQLAHKAGVLGQLLEESQAWWNSSQEGWQLLLLLHLFPDENFVPSAVQLGWLVPHHDWLSDHLRENADHPSRRDAFELATLPFHSLSFRQHGHRWNNTFALRSVVWAAFSGVPVSMLPGSALAAALEAYCRVKHAPTYAELSLLRREAQADMCLLFLQNYFGQASFDPALFKVLYEFVLPVLRRWYNRKEAQALFAAVKREVLDVRGEERHADFFPHSEPALHELLRMIVRNCDSKVIEQAINAFYKK
jgi:hypothetical protein